MPRCETGGSVSGSGAEPAKRGRSGHADGGSGKVAAKKTARSPAPSMPAA